MEIPWALLRKAALVLFGVALVAGLGSTALLLGQRLPMETWRIVFILALATLTITSAALIPGVLLDGGRGPHPEFLTDDLVDEWRELQERRVTRPHLLMLGAATAALVYVWVLFYYGKPTSAVWFGWLPVGVAAIGLALLLVAFARRTPWYANRLYRTPNRVMVIAFAGFAAAQFLGIYMTELPDATLDEQSLVAVSPQRDDGYAGSRASTITRNYLRYGPMPDFGDFDCDGDACAYVFLFLLFVALTVILVAGAALVPHMWVLSCLVLLTLIMLLVLHEVRRDRSLQQRAGGARVGPGARRPQRRP